jgi:hypothetical protein
MNDPAQYLFMGSMQLIRKEEVINTLARPSKRVGIQKGRQLIEGQ